MVHVVGFTIDLPIKLHEIYYFTFINFGMFTFLFPSYQPDDDESMSKHVPEVTDKLFYQNKCCVDGVSINVY